MTLVIVMTLKMMIMEKKKLKNDDNRHRHHEKGGGGEKEITCPTNAEASHRDCCLARVQVPLFPACVCYPRIGF